MLHCVNKFADELRCDCGLTNCDVLAERNLAEQKTAHPLKQPDVISRAPREQSKPNKLLMSICLTDAPLMKDIPKREAPLFANFGAAYCTKLRVKGIPRAGLTFSRFPTVFCLRQLEEAAVFQSERAKLTLSMKDSSSGQRGKERSCGRL